MNINASITANYFLQKARKEKLVITHMKLQKLVFIAHGWVLAILNNQLGVLDGEAIEAWKHGPVIPSLYHEFKHNQNNPIYEWSQTLVEDTDSEFITRPIHLSEIDNESKGHVEKILEAVWNSYKEYSPWGLSKKTHEPGTPWSNVYKKDTKGLTISNELIQDYFAQYLQNLAGKNE